MVSKKIMIVAGGEWQIPLIQKAKQMGHFVLNSNLFEDSPGFRFADISLVANVLDLEKNLTFALSHLPDAVITDQSDIAVTTVAHICEQLGLPGIGTEKAQLFTNKLLMREFAVKHGFRTPRFRACMCLQDLLDFVNVVGLPIVVKPPNNQSSRGVSFVIDEQQIPKAFEEALDKTELKSVLAEQFIPGLEVTVEGIKLPSQHHTLAISMKSHFEHQKTVAKSLLYRSHHPEIDCVTLVSEHNSLVEAMGLSFGLTHAEYKYWKDRPYLVEIAARGGGEPDIIAHRALNVGH